jgi:small subunit ribosomal protein S5
MKPRRPKQKSEYDHTLIDLRRVARVVAGGRRFSFRAAVVIGNKKGMVGFGVGKAGDTAQSIDKAQKVARRFMIQVPLTRDLSIPHEVSAKYSSGCVTIKPARMGKGLVAGGAARAVLSLAGVENASVKTLSHTKNKINIARATLKALSLLKTK